MKAPANKKLKALAAVYVPASRDDCAQDIAKLGELQRQLTRMQADMNDALGKVTEAWQPNLDALREIIENLQKGVQVWCEAHRNELTDNGKTKTANLVTGEVCWRQRPPSCQVRGADSVIETFERMGLERFLREKTEINKEAVLNEPEAVRGIAGISIVTGVEDFAITPFEQKAE